MDIREVWDRLGAIRSLDFNARSRSATETGWNGVGQGTVQVEQVDVATMIFYEQGFWTPEDRRAIAFKNVFRWTSDAGGLFIQLEHLRFGTEHPIYLFDLVPVSQGILETAQAHVCHKDCYSARMEYDRSAIHLCWTITGPKKDEMISYIYK